VRLSAEDYLEGGLTVKDTVWIGKVLKRNGVDLLDISSGGLLPAPIKLGPGYQVPLAEAVKKRGRYSHHRSWLDHQGRTCSGDYLKRTGRFVALGRELLRNPYWVLAARPDREIWPWQYHREFQGSRKAQRWIG